MHRRFALGTAVFVGPAVVAGLMIIAPGLQGQTQQPGPFNYVSSSHPQSAAQPPAPTPTGLPNGPATSDQVLQGRYLVTTNGCSDCHNRGPDNPNDPNWLAGFTTGSNGASYQIGPFMTYAANLTPDMATGIGMFSERQIFNAIRYGLDPAKTPDMVITSTVPGQGNFPATPFYLAPPMPWPSFRNKTDDDLWAIVAYVKHGIKPVSNMVPDSQGPPDNWASSYTPDKIGPYPLPAYPAGNETFTP